MGSFEVRPDSLASVAWRVREVRAAVEQLHPARELADTGAAAAGGQLADACSQAEHAWRQVVDQVLARLAAVTEALGGAGEAYEAADREVLHGYGEPQ